MCLHIRIRECAYDTLHDFDNLSNMHGYVCVRACGTLNFDSSVRVIFQNVPCD